MLSHVHLAFYASLVLLRLVVKPAAPSCRGGSYNSNKRPL